MAFCDIFSKSINLVNKTIYMIFDSIKTMSKILLITALFSQAYSLELSHENYDEITEGKTVFIKMFAP